MSFSFLEPVFVFVAVALVLATGGLFAWRKKPAPALFLLGAAFFALLAAGPAVPGGSSEVIHTVVLDVSGSMEARLANARDFVNAELEGHPGIELRKLQLSDALRPFGEPAGGPTSFGALAALDSDAAVNGEFVLMTDGQGSLDELLAAIDPSRVVLLRAPKPLAPDAVIAEISGPGSLLPGTSGVLTAELSSDIDVDVTWRLFEGSAVVATGKAALKSGQTQPLAHTFVAQAPGLLKLRLVLDFEGDREPRNNTATLAVHVGGKRVMLYCRDESVREQDDALLARLRSDLLNDVKTQFKVPASAAELEGVAAVIINDLPLVKSGLAREQLTPLAQWVRNGGRLMMAGVRGAFGPGGYRGTAVEDLMPVTFRPDDDKPRKILLLLDCSDSMRSAVGGQTRLELLKLAALRVLDHLSERDLAAIVGFSEGQDAIEFVPLSRKPELALRVAGLTARTTTRIKAAVTAALNAFQTSEGEQSRILLITDGEDGEVANQGTWQDLGVRASKMNVAIDVVLTEPQPRMWEKWLREGGVRGVTASVTAGGFAEILDTLEKALSAADQTLIDDGLAHDGFQIKGIEAQPKLICKTAPRRDLRFDENMLDINTPNPPLDATWKAARWPLLYRREMVGRSVALCTETYGGPLWSDRVFLGEEPLGVKRNGLDQALGFLLGQTERTNFQLQQIGDSVELIWIGSQKAPEESLKLSGGKLARLVSTGRWQLVEYPAGDELLVFSGEQLLQRIALTQPPARELRLTGDDERFFARAQAQGIRVMRSLKDWQPRQTAGATPQPLNLGWIAAALGIVCLLAGYALKRR